MLSKVRVYSKKLLRRRKLRSRFYLKNNNSGNLCRLSVHRSAQNIYAQVIDDSRGVTLASASTLMDGLRGHTSCNLELAKKVGVEIAKRAVQNGITKVIFDRGGRVYHGKIKALAEAARENGLQF